MHVSSMKSVGSVMFGLACILFLSGCTAMVLERPLSESNEFQDAALEGVWMAVNNKDPKASSKESKDILAIENVGGRYYSVLGIMIMQGQITFTLSQVPDGKNGVYRFACISMDGFFKQKNKQKNKQKTETYMLVRYTSSPNEIGIYNITKELQDGEDFKKLCQDPNRAILVTAGTEDIKKWCMAHAGEMDLTFTLKRIQFKTDLDRRRFLHVSKFLPAHIERMVAILESGKDTEKIVTEEQLEEIRKEFDNVRKWLSESGDLISPELASAFDRYLSTQLNGIKIKKVLSGFPKFADLIGSIVCRQEVLRQD